MIKKELARLSGARGKTYTIEPQEPNAGTIAAVTARATGLPALAVAHARKNGPHGTVNRQSRVSPEDN